MWALFKINVLIALRFHKFGNDMDGIAELYAKEYDKCMKRGGDMLYGVPVINGNTVAMADAIKRAFKKGQQSKDKPFNLLAELYPAAFDAYWMGAEMAPYPNPIMKPLGWASTIPAPGSIKNIGPNPMSLISSTATHKAEEAALKAMEEGLKNTNVSIPKVGDINVWDTVQKVLNREITNEIIINNPAIKSAKSIIDRHKQATNKKPSIGSQIKKAPKMQIPPTPPTVVFTNQSNIFVDPFIMVAKIHLMNVGGTFSVVAQYPPPAPPAPAIINWTGYTIKG